MKAPKSNKKKSIFNERLKAGARKAAESKLSDAEQKERSMARLEKVFGQLGNKENSYLFYCPDMPFGTTSVKTIYEFAYRLQKLGFTTKVLHEQHGFKPSWFKADWVKEVKVDYILEPVSSKSNKRPEATYRFQATDTIIIPEGFWTLAEGFKEIKPLTKVILALGYGGLMTAEPGLDWGYFGFNDVICLSENLRDDYQKVWPHFTYHVVPYSIDKEEFAPVPVNEVYPAIGLSVRNREDAQAIINIFYNRYPHLDLFEFKVLKRLDTKTYADTLKHCACLVFIDEKGGNPAPPLEAIAAGVPVIGTYGRGVSHIEKQEGMNWVPYNDFFVLAEEIAQFCLTWLQVPTVQIADKTILDNYTADKVTDALSVAFGDLQSNKIQMFTAIKKAVEEDKLAYEVDEPSQTEEAVVAEPVASTEEPTSTESLN